MVDDIIAQGGKSGVDIIVDTFIKPKLEKWKNRPKEYFALMELISNYLKKCNEKDRYMNTIVFRKETKTIDELYVPLTLIKNGNRRESITVDDNLSNIFDKPGKKLIIDTAGMGKSTLVKFLSLISINKNIGVPFTIELRRLEKNQEIIEFITEEIKLLENQFTRADIEDIIKRGDFIFFLDGYDEISEENKKDVTENIRRFVLIADNNSVILTSRDDDLLGEFTGFEKYHIKPLDKNEAYALIRKYDNDGEISEDLIAALEKNSNYQTLEEFLSNPLMVSLLYLSYQYKGVLHYKKHTFYRQVYDALFEKHDCLKGSGNIHQKHSGLDVDEFKQILSAIGFFSVKKGQIEFDRDELNSLIKMAIGFYPNINISSKDFLYDILHAVPLFVEEGIKYKWAHKSFSEYFAADFICFEIKEKERDVLKNILMAENNQKYYNILDFIYDMDYKAIIEYIIYPTLKAFVEDYQNSYMDSLNESIDYEILQIRRFYHFLDNISLVKIEKKKCSKESEKSDNFNDYLKAFDKYKDSGKSNFSFISRISRAEKVFLFIKRKNYYEAVKLIHRKNIDVFTNIKLQEFPIKTYKKLNAGVYDVDDTPSNCLNSAENFRAITSSIFHSNYDFMGMVLDYDKCCAYLESLEKQRDLNTDDLFILD